MSSDPMGTCPLGGLWWTCQNQSPTFFGCCLSDPCNGIGCPANNLTAAGMGTGSGPGASTNDGSYWPNYSCPNGGAWWICSKQTPSFQGCCDRSGDFNPCQQDGCPKTRLYAAAFSTVPVTPSSNLPSVSSLASVIPNSISSQTLTRPNSISSRVSATLNWTSSQTSGIPNSTENSIGYNSHLKFPIGAILGSALGGLIVVLLVTLALFCHQRRKKRAGFTCALQPYYQPSQDVPVTKATPSPFFCETILSDAKGSSKGYHPMLHTPSSRRLSPAPPYQSVLQSPDPSNNHEIDSTTIHEIESPPLQQWMFIP